MNDHPFDQVARLLSCAGSRRRALAAFGALVLARTTPASAASQIETAACGEAGAVCTQIKGCCEGLVCATSYTNPAYGLCVSGEGDMLPVSGDIVVPGAEGTEEELAQQVTGATGTTTGGQDGLAAQPAEIEARKAARATRRSNRRSTRNTQATRRRGNHGDTHEKKVANRDEKRTANRTARDLRGAPHLKMTFTSTDNPERLRVQNREDVAVTISRVVSLKDPGVSKLVNISLEPGETHVLDSHSTAASTSEITVWTEEDVCPAGGGGGVALMAKKSGKSKTHRLTKSC
jgi:hypothetical protein